MYYIYILFFIILYIYGTTLSSCHIASGRGSVPLSSYPSAAGPTETLLILRKARKSHWVMRLDRSFCHQNLGLLILSHDYCNPYPKKSKKKSACHHSLSKFEEAGSKTYRDGWLAPASMSKELGNNLIQPTKLLYRKGPKDRFILGATCF